MEKPPEELQDNLRSYRPDPHVTVFVPLVGRLFVVFAKNYTSHITVGSYHIYFLYALITR